MFHRRDFLGNSFTSLTFAAMLHRDARSREMPWASPTGKPHFPAKAKSVIWIFLNGGMSHLDTFDPKPALEKYAGKSIGETPFKGTQDPEKLKLARKTVVNDANGLQRNKILASPVKFQKYGQSGIEVSDWFPHLGGTIDDIAVIRSMYTTDDNHGAQTQFHSGKHMLDGNHPTLGAWVHYGLGSLNENLPQFVSIGKREYWNAKDAWYLGPAHDAIPLRIDPANPLDYGKPEGPITAAEQKIGFDLVAKLNAIKAKERPEDADLQARPAMNSPSACRSRCRTF